MLTDAQVAHFRTHGFISVDRIIAPEEVERLRVIFDTRIRSSIRASSSDYKTSEGLIIIVRWLLPEETPDIFFDSECFRKARAIAAQLLEDDDVDVLGEMFSKPPREGMPLQWHQDEYFVEHPPGVTHRGCIVWIPLDDVAMENGCIQYIPGSHKELVPHEKVDEDMSGRLLSVIDLDASSAVACEIPAGGCTVHDFKTIHSSGPNFSDRPRRVIAMRFFAGATRHMLPESIRQMLPVLESREDPAVTQGSTAAVEGRLGPPEEQPFALTMSERSGALVGGIHGVSHWRWLHVRHLFVEPGWRGRGVGRMLLDEAAKCAAARGCAGIYPDTFLREAVAFFERCGFTRFGALDDFPPGHRRTFLHKSIA